MKLVVYNNINFKIGQNALDNWKIIKSSNKEHYWVHANDVSSAHVIIEIDEPLEDDITFACIKCREFSKNVKNKTSFVVSKINNIKLGNNIGEVFFKDSTKCRNITV
jgi:predicted ribosome quality control (RQC) complex YloA/Tae2 family protein